MNGLTKAAVLFVFLLDVCMPSALPMSDVENSLNELYENLLQREYTGPIAFPNHQVERKAQRSPSLRLRFGRRSDPDMMFYDRQLTDEINQKPIRSPSLRLRFGRRSDPLMSSYSSDIFGRGMGREPRKPSGRLRWGRSDPSMNIVTDDSVNELDVQPEKRKPMRLRWGRSYNPQQVLAVQGDDEQTGFESNGIDDPVEPNNSPYISKQQKMQGESGNPLLNESSEVSFSRLDV